MKHHLFDVFGDTEHFNISCVFATFNHESGHQLSFNDEQCEFHKHHKCCTDCYLYAA